MPEISMAARPEQHRGPKPATRFSRIGRVLFALGTVLLAQCGTDSGTEEQTTETAPATNPAATTAAKATPATAPLQVNIFLELSGGMRGFMPVNTAATQPTAFQKRISQLASRTRSNPAVETAQFWLSLNKQPQKTDYTHFRTILEGDTKEAALGTELPAMLENILAQPGADSRVNVIISDFIYGPQRPADIAVMDVRITDALLPVAKKKLAVAVLGETSAFTGSFHPAVKKPREKVALQGAALPYYIWVIGPPAAVGRYINEVLPAASAKTQQAYFNLNFPAVPYAAVLTQVPATSPLVPTSEGSGSISYTGAGVSTKLEVSDVKDGVEFTVALNLNQLPAAWREPAFLNQNLKVALPGGTVRMLPNSVKRADGVQGITEYTHTLRLSLSSLPKAGGTLTLTLPAPGVPAWVAQWSTENDNQPGAAPKTYRLTEIMSGLREAFPAQLPPVFTASFSLSND